MRIKNLSMAYGKQVVFDDVNMILPDNEKIGIVGVNGAGKTTFLKIMMGIENPDTGKIIFKKNTRIDWLPQVISDTGIDMNTNVFDYLMSGRPIDKLNKELESLYEKLSTDSSIKPESIYSEITRVQEELDYYDVYNADAILLKIIDGIKISEDMLNKKLKELSGGQKSKLAFARLLYSKPEVILLDEPTNHLDIESREYITNYLKNYNGSVYIISHDTQFLDEVTTKTLFLDKRVKSFKLYDGNYSYFKKLQKEQEDNLIRQAEIEEREEKKLRDIVLMYSNSSGKRKKMAQDREKRLEKLLKNKVHIELPNKKVKFDMEINRESATIPISVKEVSFKYVDNQDYLLEDVSFDIYKGERFLVVGENGVGKSTLLKLIVGVLKPNEGIINIANKTDIGYYAQELDGLDLSKSIIDNFEEFNLSINNVRKVLGRFLFFGDEVFKKVGVLSPGERARVALAKLSVSGANFLVLDEPTNHLDPETQNLIAEVFKDYEGTMIIVSHNPEFVNNLNIERVIILPEGIISYYNKGIVEYYQSLNQEKR